MNKSKKLDLPRFPLPRQHDHFYSTKKGLHGYDRKRIKKIDYSLNYEKSM